MKTSPVEAGCVPAASSRTRPPSAATACARALASSATIATLLGTLAAFAGFAIGFLARPLGSRAMALTLRQSQPLGDLAELDAEIDKAHRKLTDDPGLVPDEWVSQAVRPNEVEFWEGSADRRHRRLSYHRVGDRWDRTQLWP